MPETKNSGFLRFYHMIYMFLPLNTLDSARRPYQNNGIIKKVRYNINE